jgi:hypothetical protein
MSKEKRALRKEVFEFMKEQGHPNILDLDGNKIAYGIVNHLIASFHEHKLNKEQSLSIDSVIDECCPKCKSNDVSEISDHYTKCGNCKFEFVG